MVYPPQSSQRYFNNTGQSLFIVCSEASRDSCLTQRKGQSVRCGLPGPARHPLGSPFLPHFPAPLTLASLPFLACDSHTPAPGPLHWLLPLPVALSPRHLHGSLPRPLQTLPSPRGLCWQPRENTKILPSGQFPNPPPAFFPTGIILYLMTLCMFSPPCLPLAFPLP